MNEKTTSILWRRLDQPGHESAYVSETSKVQGLAGSAVFVEQGQPCYLGYSINLFGNWRTRTASIKGWVGTTLVNIAILANEERHRNWYLNGVEFPEVEGCIDLDLSFSGATNLIPLRRLDFKVGEEHEVVSAWLIFPEFKLQPLRQRYRQIGENRYHYWSDNGFETELTTNEAGFVIDYPPLWTEEK